MTLVLTVDTVFDNPDAPILAKYDSIESPVGSLFLWDAAKSPTEAFNTSGGIVSNLLAEYGDAIIGNPSQMIKNFVQDGSNAILTQKTPKGGIHMIASQVNNTATVDYASFNTNADLTAYLNSRVATGKIYYSVWRKTTRKQGSGGSQLSLMHHMLNTSNYAFLFGTNGTTPQLGASGNSYLNPIISQQVDGAVGIDQLVAIRPGGITGALAANADFRVGAGNINPFSSLAYNRSPSVIYYRIYIEDLGLSGRTFEQVKAIDEAEFAKAFGVSGRFYGDTWNNPATVLP